MIPRPRLLQAWDRPAGELRLAGFDQPDFVSGWRMILWEHLPESLFAALNSMEDPAVRKWSNGSAITAAGGLGDFRELADGLVQKGLEREAELLWEVVHAPSEGRSVRVPGGGLTFETPAVVGILNLTPDSFFDGGQHQNVADAIAYALQMEADGADVIEIGGEKAGPGEPVSEDEELRRVMPVIEGLRGQSDIPISIDTRTPAVASRAIDAGVEIVNDINAFRDPGMVDVVANSPVAAVLMHIQGEPRVHQPDPTYSSVIGDITQFLHEQIEMLKSAGVGDEYIIIDPGPGFGKTTEQDMSLLRHWSELRGFPQPIMLAISRKRFIGDWLSLEVGERLEPTLAVTGFIMAQGADLIRTHDVLATSRAVHLVDWLRSEWDDFEP